MKRFMGFHFAVTILSFLVLGGTLLLNDMLHKRVVALEEQLTAMETRLNGMVSTGTVAEYPISRWEYDQFLARYETLEKDFNALKPRDGKQFVQISKDYPEDGVYWYSQYWEGEDTRLIQQIMPFIQVTNNGTGYATFEYYQEGVDSGTEITLPTGAILLTTWTDEGKPTGYRYAIPAGSEIVVSNHYGRVGEIFRHTASAFENILLYLDATYVCPDMGASVLSQDCEAFQWGSLPGD